MILFTGVGGMADPMFVAQRSNNQLALSIGDVIDIIGQDAPEYAASEYSLQMGAGGGAPSEANYSAVTTPSRADPECDNKRKAMVKILEQPQPKALRFRYICEGRSAGSIPGVRSTTENKTYPAIEVQGYKGPAVVVVSCVTVDPPYRPHPHNLVGKEGCKKGVCTMTINSETMQCVFSNLGIQCVKKRDVDEALKLREEIRVDPFQTGFSHRNQTQSIDLNSLRLCFQVFLEGPEKGKFTFPLKPVVSNPIYDKKATSDLIICKLSDCTSSVAGGKEIILLCDKVTKEDIHVRFYEVKDGMIEWEAFGDFQASDVHKQVAISFKTPRYKSLEVENPVKVYVQLLRPSDSSTSEPRPFQYLPLDSGRPFTSFKRLKNNYGLFQRILGLDTPAPSAVGVVGTDEGEVLKRKTPKVQSPPHSPGFLDTLEDTKPRPRPPGDLKLITMSSSPPSAFTQPRPAPAGSPPLAAQLIKSGPSPIPTHPVTTSSPPLLLSPDQSVDDIRQRLTATLERRKGSGTAPTSPRILNPTQHPQQRPTQFWSDDASVYSDADVLDDVLSQGSVNDLLSAVGEGLAVYEDVTGGIQEDPAAALLAPDAVYGDPSYASCYSNLEFVMGQARVTASVGDGNTDNNNKVPAGNAPPLLPPKKNPRGSSLLPTDDDFGIYGTPSGQPIHPNKAALLLERGFRGSAIGMTTTTGDDTLYYDPGGRGGGGGAPMASECDELEDMWDDNTNNTQQQQQQQHQQQQLTPEQLPRTVLDLFV
ncbi:hypothetical protein Pmani_022916 [Petrolisthes manimaculis]|uniref:RHD domain-containing protein n=1 Tax=Petrolisthes manimaculis TaxID=1843537 RepID=A0AAE1PAT7_9EUCA|nr:hypothetical protein Pmani_022916 [Petrolisthes manimaculis]